MISSIHHFADCNCGAFCRTDSPVAAAALVRHCRQYRTGRLDHLVPPMDFEILEDGGETMHLDSTVLSRGWIWADGYRNMDHA